MSDECPERVRNSWVDGARSQDRPAGDAKHVEPEQRHEGRLAWQPGQPGRDMPDRDERIRRQAHRELNPEQDDRLHGSSFGSRHNGNAGRIARYPYNGFGRRE